MCEYLYIHIPFCEKICAFCDFYRIYYKDDKATLFVKNLLIDLNNKVKNQKLKTIYLGGGTPSSLRIDLLDRLLSYLQTLMAEDCEFTLEATPSSLTEEKIQILAKNKVNRISMGVQSLNETVSQNMDRYEDINLIDEKIKLLRKYHINNISLDLIYGLPGQDLEILEIDLHQILKLDIDHLSLYALTIEKNSKFGKLKIQKIDDELEGLMYSKAIEILESYDFYQYEISSFAKNQKYSRHNLAYWHYYDFYGIGPGASGKEGLIRYDNQKSLANYLKGNYLRNEIQLTKKDQIFEALMMNLRIKDGFDINEFNQRFEIDLLIYYSKVFSKLFTELKLQIDNNKLKVSDSYYHFLHDILIEFIE